MAVLIGVTTVELPNESTTFYILQKAEFCVPLWKVTGM